MSTVAATADRLHSIAIAMLRLVRHLDVETGLGPAQLSALSVLVFGGPQSPGTLARIEQVKRPSMTRIINDLVDAGYAERFAGSDDGRAIEVRATTAGTALLRKARQRRIDLLSSWLDALDAGDRHAIQRALPALDAMVAAARAKAPVPHGRRLPSRHRL